MNAENTTTTAVATINLSDPGSRVLSKRGKNKGKAIGAVYGFGEGGLSIKELKAAMAVQFPDLSTRQITARVNETLRTQDDKALRRLAAAAFDQRMEQLGLVQDYGKTSHKAGDPTKVTAAQLRYVLPTKARVGKADAELAAAKAEAEKARAELAELKALMASLQA